MRILTAVALTSLLLTAACVVTPLGYDHGGYRPHGYGGYDHGGYGRR